MTLTKDEMTDPAAGLTDGTGAHRQPITDVNAWLDGLNYDVRPAPRALGELLVGVAERDIAETAERFATRCRGVADCGHLLDQERPSIRCPDWLSQSGAMTATDKLNSRNSNKLPLAEGGDSNRPPVSWQWSLGTRRPKQVAPRFAMKESQVPNRIEFEASVETPSLNHYRRGWAPGPGVGLAGTWLGAVVSDASGQDYWGLRGTDDFLVGMTHVVSPIAGFRKLEPRLDADPPHLFAEYSSIDWFEPLTYTDTGERLQLSYGSGRIERDADGCHWYDASGRWEMHAQTVSDIFVVHVPRQDGVADEVYYRHELMKATGKIGGVDVSGFAHQDYAYGPPGMVYAELPIARQLQGMWVSWMHEYGNGDLGGGCFWQGRDDLRFGPGYQLKDGLTTAHDDIVAKPTFNDSGKMVALDTSIGAESYSFAFDTNGSFVHVFGRLIESSTRKKPVRSWCWVEYAGGMMTPEVLDLVMQPFKLARGLTH